ncbi:hypothetical protein A2867_03160 [Candidatus Daviesbacteria bacterium RIFCSPHIGHO2_01_FULL_40_11]|uniref:Phage shock protein PspC N-terminal domain-containing protein n=1 Tax=Candidatus Daviesbacteria bacterium RIFCSPHIGHO2_01_FULL_40_11 TaxID=1797762 RepID=A0A1F5JL11_9BACT|nr:MAG: hypothetical protein A2867_03160 [Candidatus Daviesbacteria bacterium RIFCSPHIGHO2_01_FULL_40_11]OGE63021.1 MAG: hypothetical protein A2964_02280 [Candidatus Daviesbacteria bacterium RIFCSPLOWO2_01_FULL_40_27]
MKRLYRSEKNKVWLGVLGGLGEYFNIDPVILRVAFILIFVFTGFVPGLIAYLLMAVVMPTKSETTSK